MAIRENAEALLALEALRQGNPRVMVIRPDLAATMRRLGMWNDKRHVEMKPLPVVRGSSIYRRA